MAECQAGAHGGWPCRPAQPIGAPIDRSRSSLQGSAAGEEQPRRRNRSGPSSGRSGSPAPDLTPPPAAGCHRNRHGRHQVRGGGRPQLGAPWEGGAWLLAQCMLWGLLCSSAPPGSRAIQAISAWSGACSPFLAPSPPGTRRAVAPEGVRDRAGRRRPAEGHRRLLPVTVAAAAVALLSQAHQHRRGR